MTKIAYFTDEDLTAYLDGEADEPLTRRIDAALSQDPELVKRMEALMVPMGAIQDAFALERIAPGPAPVLEVPQARRNLVPLKLAASIVLAFGIGLAERICASSPG